MHVNLYEIYSTIKYSINNEIERDCLISFCKELKQRMQMQLLLDLLQKSFSTTP